MRVDDMQAAAGMAAGSIYDGSRPHAGCAWRPAASLRGRWPHAGCTGRPAAFIMAAGRLLAACWPPAASTIFTEALHVGEFFPYWDEVEIFDVNGVCTLAFNLIEQLVCSAARRVHGNADSDFIHGVCHWRWGSMISSPFGTASGRGLRSAHDVCSVLRYPCHSL